MSHFIKLFVAQILLGMLVFHLACESTTDNQPQDTQGPQPTPDPQLTPEPTPPPLTANITLLSTATYNQDGIPWVVEIFKNADLECSVSGNQTFLWVRDSRLAVPTAAYVYLVGGTQGYWESIQDQSLCSQSHCRCSSVGNTCFTSAEDFADLTQQNPSLSAFKAGVIRNMSTQSPSLLFLFFHNCNQDAYHGRGETDSKNPFGAKTVNGMLSVLSAIEYAKQRYGISKVLLHGTSSGSAGAAAIVSYLSSISQSLSGVILDSTVFNEDMETIIRIAPDELHPPTEKWALHAERYGTWALNGNFLHNMIPTGKVTTPIYHLWNRYDRTCAGDDPANSEGDGCLLMHSRLETGLKSNPQHLALGSVSRKICVSGQTTGTPTSEYQCQIHTPSNDDISQFSNDMYTGDPNILDEIISWALGRIN